ncbi:MAG: T9SS type A sorting domain-containing protein [Bacteroidota bacterium]|nr:T9SS type A sorting domain-containing protein [Bacteroidota bacterium]
MKKILLSLAGIFLIGILAATAQSIDLSDEGDPDGCNGWLQLDATPVYVGSQSAEVWFEMTQTGTFTGPPPIPLELIAPTGFKMSLTSGGGGSGYQNPLTISLTSGSISPNPILVYVVFEPTSTAFYGGDLVLQYASGAVTHTSCKADNELYIYGTGTVAPIPPAMEVQGNSMTIVNGSTSTSLFNWTDFGFTSPGVSLSRTFTILNNGGQDLILTDNGGGTYVLISGKNADKFSVTTQPAGTITAGNSTTFTVQFGPESTANEYVAKVDMASNDPNNPTYVYAISAVVNAGLATVTDPTTPDPVGATTAESSAQVTADGGAAVIEKGGCYKYASVAGDPTLLDSKTIGDPGTGLGVYDIDMTGLDPETQYKIRAYAINSVGTAYSSGTTLTFYTLSIEPPSHPASFIATGTSTTTIDLTFTASSSIPADGYVIIMRTGAYPNATLILDATQYTEGQDLGGGTSVAKVITNDATGTAQVSGLSPGTTYYFTILPYNWDGAVVATYNYNTTFPKSAFATTSISTATTFDNGGLGSSWNNPDNWDSGVPTFDQEAIIAVTTPTEFCVVDVNATCADLTIQAGNFITVNTGRTLTVNGDLLLESNSDGNASLITDGTLSVTGTTTVDQYLTGSQRTMVATPTTGSTYGTLQASPNNENDFYRWDEPTNYWIDLNNGDPPGTPLSMGVGYHVLYNKTSAIAVTKQFTGPINTSNVSPTITYSGTTSNVGWNLVGNPFPCAIDWDISDGWTKGNLQNTIYLFDGTQYISWNGSTGGIAGGILPPAQGFFVRADGGGGPYTLTIKTGARLHSTREHYKNALNNLLKLVVEMEGNEIIDETYINFNSDATDGFDDFYDGYKLPGIYLPSIPAMDESQQLYSIIPGDLLSINVLPPSENPITVQLGFEAKEDGVYTFVASELESFEAAMSITLEDLRDNVIIDLKEKETYEFTASPADAADRFVIHFSGPFAVNDIPEIEDLHIWAFDKNIYVNNESNHNGEIVIYNVMGQEILRQGLEGNLNQIGLDSQAGYYIVKVITDQQLQTEKVFIK